MTSAREQKARAVALKAEGVLADHIRQSLGPFDIDTLALSYALPAERVAQIVKRHGGMHG